MIELAVIELAVIELVWDLNGSKAIKPKQTIISIQFVYRVVERKDTFRMTYISHVLRHIS